MNARTQILYLPKQKYTSIVETSSRQQILLKRLDLLIREKDISIPKLQSITYALVNLLKPIQESFFSALISTLVLTKETCLSKSGMTLRLQALI